MRAAASRLSPTLLRSGCPILHTERHVFISPLLSRQVSHVLSKPRPHSRLRIGAAFPSQRPFSTAAARSHGDSTIYALSTAAGRAAIAVIRISGPACLDIYRTLCPGKAPPRPRRATIRSLYEPDKPPGIDTVLDSSALLLYFPAPRTVTGEDVLELHVHGGAAIVRAVLSAISRCSVPTQHANVRYAEPGEFTRRAFMNDRLDLTQVEALGDTLAATTEQQRRLSVRGRTSGLAQRYDEWRQQLLYARGELEALIDFSEDQHFDESVTELLTSVSSQVHALKRLLAAHVQNAFRGELLRNGITLSLLGAPNAGKSSLLNRIIGREAAIVSQEAGTTRDVIEVGIDLGGYLCRLGDTAGLRKAKETAEGGPRAHELIGQIEQEGMRRAKKRAAESDVVIAVLSFETTGRGVKLQMDAEVVETASKLVAERENVMVVINKTDMARDDCLLEDAIQDVLVALPALSRDRIHLVSCRDAAAQERQAMQSDPGGVQRFLQRLTKHFESMTIAVTAGGAAAEADPPMWQESLGATERQRLLLETCIGHLNDFTNAAEQGEVEDSADDEVDIVLAAENLRSAANCLARITGKGDAGDVEEVLGVVFEKFCVGK